MNAEKIKELRSLIEEERLARAGYDCSPGTERWQRVCSVQAAAKAAAYAELPALLDEVEALTADAERYRWLRANAVYGRMETRGPRPDFAMNCDEPETEWDAAIDAARHEPKDAE